MIRSGRNLGGSIGLFALLLMSNSAASSETRQFSYDALGRLVAVDVNGGPADGASRDYNFDDAGNRTNVTGSPGAGGASTCELRTFDVQISDGFEALVKVEPLVPCAANVPLVATLTHLSGTGTWSSAAFNGSSTLNDGQGYKIFKIVPVAGSVPHNEPLVLRVSFSTSASHATFLIAHSTVTITGS